MYQNYIFFIFKKLFLKLTYQNNLKYKKIKILEKMVCTLFLNGFQFFLFFCLREQTSYFTMHLFYVYRGKIII